MENTSRGQRVETKHVDISDWTTFGKEKIRLEESELTYTQECVDVYFDCFLFIYHSMVVRNRYLLKLFFLLCYISFGMKILVTSLITCYSGTTNCSSGQEGIINSKFTVFI